LLPAALLLGVAVLQIWLARVHALSPWAGGGFGMFSTTDVRGNRHLHAFATHPGVRREVRVPVELHSSARRVLAFPSERAQRDLALRLLDIPDATWGTARSIEIQVWATRFDPLTLAPSAYLLRSHVVSVAAP
jgi:hypothetical protein